MEFLVAALFVLDIILAIIIYSHWDIIKLYKSTQTEYQGWNIARFDILFAEFKKLKAKVESLEKKMQDEKIRTEEFVHGVYKDYTNYIDTEWKKNIQVVTDKLKTQNETLEVLKEFTNPKPVKRTSK